MVSNNFPVNEAKPLIEIPTDIPEIGFLGGKQGEEINNSIKEDYKGFDVLQIGKYSRNLVKGSNPFYVVAVQDRLPAGIRVATQGDLERAIKTGVMDFRKTYEDTGLILRTDSNPNSYLARDLMAQVKARNKRQEMPVMLHLYELTLIKDSDSPYRLKFKLKDGAEIINAPILNQKSENFSSEDIDLKTGLPTKLGNGNRTWYARDKGLSRLYLYWNLDLSSSNDCLAGSSDYGRVVLVSTAESGSQPVFQERLKELEIQRDKEIEKINERYQRAQKVLRGKD